MSRRQSHPAVNHDGTKPGFDTGVALKAALLALATLAVYLPVLRAGFIWDDDTLVTQNPILSAPNGLRLIWFSTLFGDFIPLTLTSYWLEYRAWGLAATGYHVTNVALHALSAVVFWRLLSRLRVPGAFWAALLFAVHPVNVESVAWVAQRKNVLALVFYAASLLFFVRFEELANGQAASPSATGLRTDQSLFAGLQLWYGCSLGAFLLSLLSKPAGVTLPIVLLAIVWWKHGRISRRDFWQTTPFFLLALAISGMAIWIQHRQILYGVERTAGFPSRLAGAGWAAWFYAGKALAPLNLCFVYPRWQLNPASLVAWLPGLAWLLWLALLWRYRPTWSRGIFFAFGYYLLTLLPVLGLFHIYYFRYSPVADHYQYFSLIALLALVVGLGERWLAQRSLFLGVPLTVLFGALTWQQTQIYRDSDTLWQATLARNPAAWLAHSNLGRELLSAGKFEEAIARFEAARRVEPEAPEVENNWGLALSWLGNLSEAEGHFKSALRLNPQFGNAHFNYANLLCRTGRLQEAVDHYQAALQTPVRDRSLDVQIHNNVGTALAQLGRLDEAVSHFRTSLQIEPNYAAWENLGRASRDLGKLEVAVECFQAALRATNSAEIHCELGGVLSAQGKTAEAIGQLQQSLQIQPDLATAHCELGLLLLRQQETEQALGHLRQAVKTETNSPALLNNIAWLLATSSDNRLRNGPEAVSAAERACALVQPAPFSYLDTLAAAYAEAGRFEEAVKTARQAVALAGQAGTTEKAQELRRRLEIYQVGRPYHADR